jgi:hypothetical protein
VERNLESVTQKGKSVVSWAEMNSTELREYFTDAIRFWEPRRVVYNLVLAAIVIAYFFAGYPSSKGVLSMDFALGLFRLAVAANVAYCAAYLVDIFLQAFWISRVLGVPRWIVFVIGTAFAAVITRLFVMGMGSVD